LKEEDEIGRTHNTHGTLTNAYTTLYGEPEEAKPFEEPRRKWADNIKNDVKITREIVGWA
jgi:hypothetical protein